LDAGKQFGRVEIREDRSQKGLGSLRILVSSGREKGAKNAWKRKCVLEGESDLRRNSAGLRPSRSDHREDGAGREGRSSHVTSPREPG